MAASSSSAHRRIKFTDEVYLMIGLHASKYPDQPVLGYLIGNEANDQYTISDIFPVSHSIPAGPILEMSAELAERSTTQGNQVLGFYYGLEYHHSSHFTVPSYVERITANFKNILGHQAIVVQINNNLIGETKKLFVDGSLVAGTPVKVESLSPVPDLSAKFAACIAGNRHLLLNDFEEHMNSDAFADYRNKELLNSLKSI